MDVNSDDTKEWADLMRRNSQQEAEIERLRAALKECSDDLENEIEHRYRDTLDYPSQKLKFDRDMEPVLTARKLLAVIDEQSVPLVHVGRDGNAHQGERECCTICLMWKQVEERT